MVFLKTIQVAALLRKATFSMICVGAVLAVSQSGCAPSGLGLQDYLIGVTPGIGPVSGLFLPDRIKDWDHALKASGEDPLGEKWELTVRWREGKLLRDVYVCKGDTKIHFVVPLKNSPSATGETLGVTSTRYGPYQPAFADNFKGKAWGITMEHGVADFRSVKDLKKELRWVLTRSFDVKAFDPSEGTLVTVQMSLKGEPAGHGGGKILGNSLNIDIYNVTINGEPPDPEEFKGFNRGEVRLLERAVD